MDKIAIFRQIPATESQIDRVVRDAKDKILSGNWNPLDLEVQLKAMEETIKRIRADRDVKNYVEEEMDKYPDKSFKHGSATLTRSSRKSYEYSNDEEWRRIKGLENQVAEERKVRERKLVNGFVDTATGEVVDPMLPVKNTFVLMIKFDK